jgi:hypothetical protein
MLFYTIKELASGRLEIKNGKVYARNKLYHCGYCMNDILARVI